MSARTLAIANQKGGVGKTTTAINLATALAMAGQRVLLVDMDPQANLTSGVGLKGSLPPAGTVYQALTGEFKDANAFVLPTRVDRMALVPADRNLTGAEVELVLLPNRERRLRALVHSLRDRFDYVFIDTPPSLGLLTLNALVAADAVLIPLTCEYFALEGIADLVATLRRVRGTLNPALDIAGVLMTMYDERTNLGQQVARDIRGFFQERVFETVIPRNIRLGEAPSHGMPAILYDAKSRGAEAYVLLARELLARATAPPSSLPGSGGPQAQDTGPGRQTATPAGSAGENPAPGTPENEEQHHG
jgi:chromosome partitioning protein